MRRLAPACLLLGLLAGCAQHGAAPFPSSGPAVPSPGAALAPPAAHPGAILFITADLRGYLEPCGCSDNMQGGIARAAAQLDAARAEGAPILFFDAGDSLFAHPQLAAEEVVQEERKARALATALERMGVKAKAVGPLDRVRGEEFLRSLGLPLLSAGASDAFAAGDLKVGVAVGDTFQSLPQAAAKARNQGATLVLGFWLGPTPEAQRLVESPALGVDLLVAAHGETEISGEQNLLTRTAVPLVRLQSKGRSLLRLDVFPVQPSGRFVLLKGSDETEHELKALTQRLALLDREVNFPGILPAKRALLEAKIHEVVQRRERVAAAPVQRPPGQSSFEARFVPLEASLPSSPGVAEIVHGYDQEVGNLNLAWARAHGKDCPLPAKGQAGYVGNEACRACHEETFAVYDRTRHAHAYATLERVGKQYRVDCIACHVIGIQQPGGVCRVDKVAGRENVGCENCHGPGSLHVADPTSTNIRPKPGQNVCVGCHNPENSPHFDFAVYLPQILGKGHQAKH